MRGPRAGPGLAPAACGPDVGLVATDETRWGGSGPPQVTGVLRPISVGRSSPREGFGSVAGAGRALCAGGAGPAAGWWQRTKTVSAFPQGQKKAVSFLSFGVSLWVWYCR